MTSAGTPTGQAGRVRAVVAPAVEEAGLHLEDVVVTPSGRRTLVRVVVDLREDEIGSLGSERLGNVSRRVSAAMDEADVVRGEHVLEVSTPGTDRPLTEVRHFLRARTRLVRLVLQDGRTAEGRLADVRPEGLVLRTDEGERHVDLADVVRGEVQVELGAGADTEDEEA